MSKLDRYYFDGSKKLDLSKLDTDGDISSDRKEEIIQKTAELQEEIAALQDKFYADGREGLIIVLQAMDAAGKDSTVKHVFGCVNPQGIHVHSFKTPNKTELAHDYLWRINQCLPERGQIALLNRSHYEDVLIVKVRKIYKTYHMAERCFRDSEEKIFKQRYKDISNYEKYLYHNGYRIVKIFLNVSKKEQKERFLERLSRPEKNWKFSSGDLDERKLWDEYQKAYEDAVNGTAAKNAPWYVLPADRKWYTRYLVSLILRDTLKSIDPKYPELPEEERAMIDTYKEQLEAEE